MIVIIVAELICFLIRISRATEEKKAQHTLLGKKCEEEYTIVQYICDNSTSSVHCVGVHLPFMRVPMGGISSTTTAAATVVVVIFVVVVVAVGVLSFRVTVVIRCTGVTRTFFSMIR